MAQADACAITGLSPPTAHHPLARASARASVMLLLRIKNLNTNHH